MFVGSRRGDFDYLKTGLNIVHTPDYHPSYQSGGFFGRMKWLSMWEILLSIFCGLLMIIGLVGVILPLLPGVPLAWLGLFIYAIVTGFDSISLVVVLVFLGLTIMALALDFLIPLLGAKKYRASKYGILGAFLGLTIGMIIFGFPGIIIGPLVGAFLGEIIAKREGGQAFKSAFGTFLGFLAGTLIKIVLVLIILGFFIASFF